MTMQDEETMKRLEGKVTFVNGSPVIKTTMHQFMSAIWDLFGSVKVPDVNGVVEVLRDEPVVNWKELHPGTKEVLCYWFQFSQNHQLAIVPFDAEVFVNYEGDLVIPNQYVQPQEFESCYDESMGCDLILRFYQKAPKLDLLQHL